MVEGRLPIEIHAQLGPQWLASAVAERAASTQSRTRPSTSVPSWAAVAAAVLVAIAVLPPIAGWQPWRFAVSTPDHEGSSPDRIKGDAVTLMVYRNTGGTSEALSDGDAAATGDLLRIAYRASKARYGIIISIDGRGVVTRHLPAAGETAIALQLGELVPLPNAYELDDAPRWERFFLITSEKPFEIGAVIEAAKATTGAPTSPGEAPESLTLPRGLEQTSFLLRKIS